MPVVLTIQRTTVPASERQKYFERIRASESHYSAANCRFRVFEEQMEQRMLQLITRARAANRPRQ